jgi:serine protease SohB
MFGKNTDEDRAKLTEELEDVHVLFRDLITRYRPELDMDRVATGEHWYGSRALGLGLVDALQTSDDFLLAAIDASDLYSVRWKGRKTITEKVVAAVEGSADAVLRRLGHAGAESRYGAG